MALARLSKSADLLAFFGEHKIEHLPSGDGVEFKGPNGDGMFARWEQGLPYVQVIYPFIGDVPAERAGEVCSAVVRVNNTIKLPGFGYQHDNRFVYMRLCVQLDDEGSISVDAFQRQVLACVLNAKEFVEAFRDVIKGAPASEVLDLAVKHNQG